MTVTTPGTQGWSFGVQHQSSNLGQYGGSMTLRSDTTSGTNTATCQNGSPPDTNETAIRSATTGYTQGIVVDSDGGYTLPAVTNFVQSHACYDIRMPSTSGTYSATLKFSHDLGTPRILTLVSKAGQSNMPCANVLTLNITVSPYVQQTPSWCWDQVYGMQGPGSPGMEGAEAGGMEAATQSSTSCGVSAPFRRGDANNDGSVDISDAVKVLVYLFNGATAPACLDAGDANDSGLGQNTTLEISDAIYLLAFLFTGGPAPPAPYPGCGSDPTADGLSCLGGIPGCLGQAASVTLFSPPTFATSVSQDVQLISRRLDPKNSDICYPVLYEFEVSMDPAFGNFTATSKKQEYTTFFPYNLDPGTIYFWRVRATDSSTPTQQVFLSDIWSFTTRAVPAAKIWFASPVGTQSTNCNTDHADAGMDCSLDAVNLQATPGSIVFLKANNNAGQQVAYTTQIKPMASPRTDTIANGEADRIRYQPYEGQNTPHVGVVMISAHQAGTGTNTRGFRFSADVGGDDTEQRSFITVDGRLSPPDANGQRTRRIVFQGTRRHWGDVNGTFNVVRNCELKPYAANQTDYRGLYFHTENSDHNRIINNSFDKGCICVGSSEPGSGDCSSGEYGAGDVLHLRGSSFNVIQDNDFKNVGHACIEFSSNTPNGGGTTPPFGERNVVRGNTFSRVHNAISMTGSFNLVEYNSIFETGCGKGSDAGCYLKVDGEQNIVRFNLLVDDDCLEMQGTLCVGRTYEEELVNIGLENSFFNRFYHNVVYGGTFGTGLLLKQDQNQISANPTIRDNSYLNNAITNNCLGPDGNRQANCDATFTQVFHGFKSPDPELNVFNRFAANLIWGNTIGNLTIFYRICLTQSASTGYTLQQAVAAVNCQFPPTQGKVFDGTNLELDPDTAFVHRQGPAFNQRDFHLKDDQANLLINSAQPLAVIQSTSMSGAKLSLVPQESTESGDVPTSSFFFDGGGSELGDVGDLIRVVRKVNGVFTGEHFVTRVTTVTAEIDGANQLDVDPPLPLVGAGDEIHLYFFNGCVPDMGRYESPY